MQGWIKLHRKLLHSSIFQNPNLLKFWIWCLLKASHCDHNTRVGLQEVELKEGQFIFGRNKAGAELNMNPSTVYRYLSVIEKEGLACAIRNNKFTVVTIANWGLYQTVEHENGQQMNNKRTTNEQQMNTNKNVKNVNNIYDHFYEQIWSMYPVKKGKAKVSLTQKKKLHAIGLEEMTRAINRYKKENEGKDKQYIQHGSTFFNSGYVDYLDANYEQTKSTLKEVEIEW